MSAAASNDARALRTLPNNIEAEKALLGAIFADNRAFEKVSGFLRAEHFAVIHHGRIFEAAAVLIERGQIADPITLKRYFDQDEALAEIGGLAYLKELAHAAVGSISAGQYGELVADLHAKRALIQAGEDLVAKAYDGSADATSADILSEHAAELDRLADECPAPLRINGKLAGAMDPITLDGKPTPDRRWLVDGWIPHGTVTMLSGDGGVGKSLLVMQLLTCAAIGKDWLGQRTEPCKAVGIFCEDARDELHRRQDAINRHYGVGFADLENMQWCYRVGEENALMTWEGFDVPGVPTGLFRQIQGWAKDFSAQLIVFDALHDFFAGDENRRPHARQFIQLLADLARDCDGAVVLTAHPSLSGRASGTGESGSTAWNNAVRSRLYLTKSRDEGDDKTRDERVLQRRKANYAGDGDGIPLRWHQGVFMADEHETGIFASIRKRSVERAFMDLLAEVASEGRPVSDSRNAGNYAPRIFSRRPGRQGFKKADFEKAMEVLFTNRRIRVEEYGRASDTRRRIVIVKPEGAAVCGGCL